MFRENKKHLQGQMFSTVDGLPLAQARRLGESWAGVFYREFFSRLDERPFAVLYAQQESRPNIPVNVLMGLETLKAGFNWSDEEMHDAFCFDLQVRFALGYRTLGEGSFELRTVYNFRRRLGAHMRKTGEDLFARAFEQVSDAQLTVFRVKTGKVRMDSSEIASNIRTLSRLHLLVEIVQRVQRMLSPTDQARYADAFAPYCQGSSGQFVYRVRSAEGAAHMERLGTLMGQLLAELAADYRDASGYQLLQRVFTEHFVVEEARISLKPGNTVGAASLQSPDDPEATCRTKNGTLYRGYVVNVTETCDPANPLQLIAAVQTAPNVTNDDDLLIQAAPALKERLDVTEMHTDGGFNSEPSADRLRGLGITHVQTGLRGHAPHIYIGLAQFTMATAVDAHPVAVTCPGGQTATIAQINGTTPYQLYRAHFATTACLSCPFDATCLARPMASRPLRTLSFDAHDLEIARRRQRLAHDRQEGRNLRVAIESTIASLKHPFNYGQLPVRGLFRIGMLLVGSAAMTNVRRIHRFVTRRQKEEGEGTPSRHAFDLVTLTSISFRSPPPFFTRLPRFSPTLTYAA